MSYLSYERVAATDDVKDADDLTIPNTATHAELQADTQDVRYTMDDSSDPDQSSGMILIVGLEAKAFLIDDVRNIRFHRGAGSNGNLNLHYFTG